MEQFKIQINKKHVFILYLLVIVLFSIPYYALWVKDDKCFVINEKLNLPSAKIIRENLCATILSNTDGLPYEKKKLKELLDRYLMYNKEIVEQFSKSNAILTKILKSETFKTIFISDDVDDILNLRRNELLHTTDSNECQESDKVFPMEHLNRDLIKQIILFENFKNCLSKADTLRRGIVSNYIYITPMGAGYYPPKEMGYVIDLFSEEIDKNEKVLDAAEESLDNYLERLPDKSMPSMRFFDFLYFSITSATTTGYGDILPNSTYIRILVSGEILCCLVVFGLFLSLLGKGDWVWIFPKDKKKQ